MEGMAWLLQAADGSDIEAPSAWEFVCSNPTDREKNGTNRNLLLDEHSVCHLSSAGPIGMNSVSLGPLLKERAAEKEEGKEIIRNLCLDAGYVGKEGLVKITDSFRTFVHEARKKY